MNMLKRFLLSLLIPTLAFAVDSVVPVSGGGMFTKVVYDWTSDASGNATGQTSTTMPGETYKAITSPGSTTPSDNYDIVVKQVYVDRNGTEQVLSSDMTDSLLLNRDNASVEEVALWPDTTGLVGGKLRFIITNAGNAKTGRLEFWVWQTLQAGTFTVLVTSPGDVVGPSSSTDNALARYDGTTGRLLQDSQVTVSDIGVMSLPGGVTTTSGTASSFGGEVSVGGNTYSDTIALKLNAASGQMKKFITQSAGVERWRFGQGTTSNFEIDAYDSGGIFQDLALEIDDASGGIIAMNRPVTMSTTLGVTTNLTVTGDAAVNGGDLTSTAATFNAITASTTTNIATSSTANTIGATTGTTTIRNASIQLGGTNANVAVGSASSAFQGFRVEYTPTATTSQTGIQSAFYPSPASDSANNFVGAWSTLVPKVSNFTGIVSGHLSEVFAPIAAKTVSTGYGYYASFSRYDATQTGTITDMKLFNASVSGGSGLGSGGSPNGSVTNLYGLYVGDITAGGTLNYAIYTNAGTVRFGGDLVVVGSVSAGSVSYTNLVVTGTSDLQGAVANSTGTLNLNDNVLVGASIDSNTASFNAFLTPTTFTFATAGTTVTMGAQTGSFNAQNPTFTFGSSAATTQVVQLVNIAGNTTDLLFTRYSSGVKKRWGWQMGSAAESGSDAGSNIALDAYNDAGTSIDSPITITRASGGAITFNRNLTEAGDIAINGGDVTSSASTMNVFNSSTTVTAFTAATSLTMGNAATTIAISNAAGGAPTLTLGGNIAFGATFAASSQPGTASRLALRKYSSSANRDRWDLRADNAAESGSDSGSDFRIAAYTDAGVFIDYPILITRATGGAITIARPLVGAATQSVFNTTSTTINAFGAASTAINMGHASGTTTMLGTVVHSGASTHSSTTALNGTVTMGSGIGIATNSTTGTIIATANTQKLAFWGATAIVQPASANQAAVSLDTTLSGIDTIDLSGVESNFTAIQTLVNQLRSDLVSAGLIKGSAIVILFAPFKLRRLRKLIKQEREQERRAA